MLENVEIEGLRTEIKELSNAVIELCGMMNNLLKGEQYISKYETAKRLNVSPTTIDNYLEEGVFELNKEFIYIKNGKIVFLLDAVIRMKQEYNNGKSLRKARQIIR